MAWGVETSGLWRSIQPGEIFAGTAGCGDGVYRSTDNGDSWTLANTGLTSTDIAGLGINSNGHIFAATRSIMGEGGGMFRSTDDGDSWTEQNSGFMAVDANAVTFNSVGNVFGAAAGGVFLSTNDGASWTDISSGLIPAGGNVGALAMDSGNYAYAGTAGAGVFRSVRSTTHGAGDSETKASANAGTAALRAVE